MSKVLNRFAATLLCLLLISCARPRHIATAPATAPAAPHSDAPDDAAEFLRQERVIGPGPVPGERYLAARRRARAMRQVAEHPAAVTFGTWQSLGPGNVGGRTRALIIHPQNPSVMWVGGATAGVWKTTDAGQSWTPLTDFLPTLVLNSMVLDPNNPDVLYAGTGEQTQNWRGAGIFKTSDGGQTWNQLGGTANSDFYFVNQMAVSKNTGYVYAATNSGLWSSPDGGGTWSLALAAPSGGPSTTSNGGTNAGCFDVAVSPGATDTVFAVCHPQGSSLYAIYRNLDAAGAGTWEQVHSDPQMWYTALAIAPSQPSTIYAISVTHDTSSPYAKALLAVYRSTSNGDAGSWETRTSNTNASRLNTAILSVDAAYNFNSMCNGKSPVYTGQDGYNLALAVDPLDANRVWAGGIGLFRSDDGGANWGYTFLGAHPDQHYLRFDPNYDGARNQVLYAANDGGIYKTSSSRGVAATCDSPLTSVRWSALNNSYGATQFYHGTPYPGGTAYFGGTQDNGTVRGTDAGGLNQWSPIYGGDGGVSRLNPVDASTVYVEYVHGALARSSDGGVTYADATSGITESSSNFTFIAFYTFDPNNSLRLYVGGSQLWRTEDGMQHWTAASAPIPAAASGAVDSITSIAVSPADSNLMVFGSRFNGAIYRSTSALSSDGGTVWSSARPRAGNVSHLEFDPNQPNTVYATYSTFKSSASDQHVYRSTDGGATWTGIDGAGANALPDVPVNTLLVDPDDSSRIYLGTDLGMFASFDGGVTWARDANPFADVMTRHLAIDRTGGRKDLYAFTYGRGVWRAALGTASANGSSCSYSLAPGTVTADAAGGTVAVTVSTQGNCPWTALPNRSGTGFATPQAPASGVGSGTAYITVPPNSTGRARGDAVVVQNQAIAITQGAGFSVQPGDEAANARAIASLPYQDSTDNSGLTGNASDPTHSCTGSADARTGWFQFTAASTGRVQIMVTATQRGSSAGDGVVVAAYAANGGGPGAEVACATVAKSSSADLAPATAAFDVTAGSVYWIETAAPASNAASDIGSWSISVTSSGGAATVALSPSNVALAGGQSAQFSANFSNLKNQAVRWSVSPQVGSVSAAGVYTAPGGFAPPQSVTVTAQSLANPALQSSATVTALANLPVTLAQPAVTNAASFKTGAVAPGEVVTLFGSGMGPAKLMTAQLDAAGRVASLLGGTQVLFDGTAAPLVYVSDKQVSAIVPYGVAGQSSTQMTVVANGQSSPGLTLPVAAAAPALFTSDASGAGQAAAFNQDGSLNLPQNGAAAGTIVTLFGTGEGQTTPVGLDGLIANSTRFPAPAAGVSATIGGVDAPVVYAGAAPLEVAGVLQLNVRVPAGLKIGANAVVVTVGGAASPLNVTVTVK